MNWRLFDGVVGGIIALGVVLLCLWLSIVVKARPGISRPRSVPRYVAPRTLPRPYVVPPLPGPVPLALRRGTFVALCALFAGCGGVDGEELFAPSPIAPPGLCPEGEGACAWESTPPLHLEFADGGTEGGACEP